MDDLDLLRHTRHVACGELLDERRLTGSVVALLAAGATFGWPSAQTDPALLTVDTWACTDDVKDFPGPAGLPVEDTYSTDHYKNYDDGGTGLGSADPAAAS